MFGQIPDFNAGLEFFRRMWGNAAGMPTGLMPGLQAMTPPMSLEEVDKRIHDLKAVESWLELNANLLRTTIHGLEVQRATLVALQTFGNALSPEAMQQAMENVARAANAPSAASRRPFGGAGPEVGPAPSSGAPTGGGGSFAGFPGFGGMPGGAPGAEGVEPEALRDDEGDGREARDAGAPDRPGNAPGSSAAAAGAQAGAEPGPQAGVQAALWWDMVQRQFNQIASSAAAASLASLNNLQGLAGAQAQQPGTDEQAADDAGAPEAAGTARAPGDATPADSGSRAPGEDAAPRARAGARRAGGASTAASAGSTGRGGGGARKTAGGKPTATSGAGIDAGDTEPAQAPANSRSASRRRSRGGAERS